MKYPKLGTFKFQRKFNWIQFNGENSGIKSIKEYSTDIIQKEKRRIINQMENKENNNNKIIINEEIRKCLNLLPKPSKRLDQNEKERNDSEEIFINSLNQTKRQHKRVGSTYSKARSPVYFPNINIQLVRPSESDKGDPFTVIFRCDIRLTKPDIFNYLSKIYGIGITSIRTAIYRNKNRRRIKSKIRGGIIIDNKKGERTFKKVWINLDKPFFFPSTCRRNFLNENFNFSDLLNNFNRNKLIQSQQSKINVKEILPAGLEDKGARENVFRNILDSKQSIEVELKNYVKNSLSDFTPHDDDLDSIPSTTNQSKSKEPKKFQFFLEKKKSIK